MVLRLHCPRVIPHSLGILMLTTPCVLQGCAGPSVEDASSTPAGDVADTNDSDDSNDTSDTSGSSSTEDDVDDDSMSSESSDPSSGSTDTTDDTSGTSGDTTDEQGTGDSSAGASGPEPDASAAVAAWNASVTLLGASTSDQYGNAVGIDDEGNIYVGGTAYGSIEGVAVFSSSDGFVSKYNSALEHQWTTTVSAIGAQAVEDLVVLDGHVYACGTTFGNLPGFDELLPFDGDVFVMALSLDGAQEWLLQTGTMAEEKGRAISAVRNDGIYVAGHTMGTLADPDAFAEDHDAALFKVSLQGDLVWHRQWGNSDLDMAHDVLAVPGHGAIVVGTTYIPGAEHFDATITRISATGSDVWKRTAGGSGNDFADRVARLPSGELIIAGVRGSPLSGVSPIDNSDLSLARMTMDGEMLEQTLLSENGEAQAHALVVTATGNVVLGGQTSGCLEPGCDNSALDALVLDRTTASADGFGWQWGGAQDDWLSALAHHDGPNGTRLVGVGSACVGPGTCDAAGDRQILVVVLSPKDN